MNDKEKILNNNLGFKNVFKATVAFYLAQTLMGIIGITILLSTIFLAVHFLGGFSGK